MPTGYRITDGVSSFRFGNPWGMPLFFPLGWSEDGNTFAYLVEENTDGVGSIAVFKIQSTDAGKDFLVKIGGEGAPEGQRFASVKKFWEAKQDTIQELLAKYKIRQNSDYDLQKGKKIKMGPELYSISAGFNTSPKIPTNSNYPVVDNLTITLGKRGAGSKSVLTYKYEESEKAPYGEFHHLNKFDVVGIIPNPEKTKALILIEKWEPGWEGGSDCYIFTIGCDLTKDFQR